MTFFIQGQILEYIFSKLIVVVEVVERLNSLVHSSWGEYYTLRATLVEDQIEI